VVVIPLIQAAIEESHETVAGIDANQIGAKLVNKDAVPPALLQNNCINQV
jgi:hypothetical protein